MLRSVSELQGYVLAAKDGEIGLCKDFLFDDRHWVTRYKVADTGKWLPGRKVLVTPPSIESILKVKVEACIEGRCSKVMLRIKRVYEDATKSDGRRVLVDRLWPRGLSKEEAGVDLWLKNIAPTSALRKWFGHNLEKWTEFKRRYAKYLED